MHLAGGDAALRDVDAAEALGARQHALHLLTLPLHLHVAAACASDPTSPRRTTPQVSARTPEALCILSSGSPCHAFPTAFVGWQRRRRLGQAGPMI